MFIITEISLHYFFKRKNRKTEMDIKNLMCSESTKKFIVMDSRNITCEKIVVVTEIVHIL